MTAHGWTTLGVVLEAAAIVLGGWDLLVRRQSLRKFLRRDVRVFVTDAVGMTDVVEAVLIKGEPAEPPTLEERLAAVEGAVAGFRRAVVEGDAATLQQATDRAEQQVLASHQTLDHELKELRKGLVDALAMGWRAPVAVGLLALGLAAQAVGSLTS